MQQHLAFHSGSVDGPTSYEIDWINSYGLIRYGRILSAVEERFGEKAANVVSNLITLGHTRIKDLREAYFPSPEKEQDDSDDEGVNGKGLFVNGDVKSNGLANGTTPAKVNGVKRSRPDDEEEEERTYEERAKSIQSVAELDSIIYELMVNGWVMQVDWRQYLGSVDLYDLSRAEAIEFLNNGKEPTGTKEKEIVAMGMLQRKREMRDQWLTVERPTIRKRTAADLGLGPASSNKRTKTSNTKWATRDDEVVVLDEDLVIRVNPEKPNVAMRTDILTSVVRRFLGPTTAKVYECMLRQLEKEQPRCYDPYAEPVPHDPSVEINREVDPRLLVSAREVAQNIDPDVDLLDGLDPEDIVQFAATGSRVNDKGVIDPPIDPFSLHEDTKMRFVDKHIHLLADHPFKFVIWHSRAGMSQWRIEFDELAENLIQYEIEQTIAAGNERERKYGVKLVRALKKKGKLDERMMGNVMMMHAGDIRSVVNSLTLRGFVQTQEIPKVERREAKLSIHLIWYDRQRARDKLLQDTYKGMLRHMQRLAYERNKVAPLLAKAERTDVAGQEEKWLSKEELEALKHWKEVQGRLLLQAMRCDELVAVLRDWCGPLITP